MPSLQTVFLAPKIPYLTQPPPQTPLERTELQLNFHQAATYYAATLCQAASNQSNDDDDNDDDDADDDDDDDEIVVLDKIECTCLIIDVACPFDVQVKDKEKEKIENYQDLKQELKWIWKLHRVTVVPIIIGALGTVSKDLKKWLAEIGVTCHLESLQRACLLGTARILCKVLDT